MPLAPGTFVGSYEVLSSLGAGGMGEVYRARDRKLKRDVALKVLPDSFAQDADRMASDESQRYEVYVAAFPGPGGKRQISTSGGVEPRWRQDGKEIFYIAPDGRLMAAAVSMKGDVLDVGAVSPLFAVTAVGAGYRYDVSSDGRHFLVRTPTTATAVQPLTVVQNWTALLRNK